MAAAEKLSISPLSVVDQSQKSSLKPSPPKGNAFRSMRLLMGLAMFTSYCFLLLHRQVYGGVVHFAGLEFSFWKVPEFLATPPCSVALYVVGLVCSLIFALGYSTRICGLALLTLHCVYNDGYVWFGWEMLVDPVLICILLESIGRVPRQRILQVMRVGATIAFAWVAWSQLSAAPWLQREMMTRYVSRAPVSSIYPTFLGLIPLVEIIGGSAWLLLLTAPAMFWYKPTIKYWTILLLASELSLLIFMPISFWNSMVIVAVIPFMPEEWLTLSRDYWKAKLPDLRLGARAISFFVLMLVMLCTMFNRNIAEQFTIFKKIEIPEVEKAYKIVTNPFVKTGNLILFNSIWKMYSPTWRHVVWIEWFATYPDGSVVLWPQENFSPEYRMNRRTWLEALWTDFKKEKVFVGMLSGKNEKATYGQYLCHVIAEQTGKKPTSMHMEINSFDIRGPDDDWSLFKQAPERVEKEPEVSCD